MATGQLLGVAKAALHLDVSEKTIRRWRDIGRLPDAAGWTTEELEAAARRRTKRPESGRAPGTTPDTAPPAATKTDTPAPAEPGTPAQNKAGPASAGPTVPPELPAPVPTGPPPPPASRALIRDLELPREDDSVRPPQAAPSRPGPPPAAHDDDAPAGGLFEGW